MGLHLVSESMLNVTVIHVKLELASWVQNLDQAVCSLLGDDAVVKGIN